MTDTEIRDPPARRVPPPERLTARLATRGGAGSDDSDPRSSVSRLPANRARCICSPAVVQHTLSVLVENKPGVLSRVAGLFTRRGFNIDSLAVSPTEDPKLSRMTIAVDASRFPVEQITKQLDKLVNVIRIRDLDPANMVARELMLLKVAVGADHRAEVIGLAEIFEARIADVTAEHITVELTGQSDELVRFEELMRPYGLIELVKTGVVALGRGAHTT